MIVDTDSDRRGMDCARVARDEITEQYITGRLGEDDQVAFELHYFQCDRCFEELKNYRALRAALEQVSASIQHVRRVLWAGAGAAAIIAIGLLTWRQTSVTDREADRAALPAQPVDTTLGSALAELGAIKAPRYRPLAPGRTPNGIRDYERGDYGASALGLAAAASLDPSSPDIHFYLGASYLLSGDTDAAVRALQRTVDLGESAYAEDARFFLAKAAIRRGNLNEGRTLLLRVASGNSDYQREAQSLLAALDTLPKPTAPGGIDARIVKVDGMRAYINIGASTGVKVGDTFSIVHREERVDPATGVKRAEQTQTGTGVVVEVQQRFAIIEVTGKAATADVIKKM